MGPHRTAEQGPAVELLIGGPPERSGRGDDRPAPTGSPTPWRRWGWPSVGLAGLAAALVAFPPTESAPPPQDPGPPPLALAADPWYELAPGGLLLSVPLRADAGRWEIRTGAAEPGVEITALSGPALSGETPQTTRFDVAVDCERALSAPRAASLTLAVAPWPAGGGTRPWRLDPLRFGDFWDDALHTACGKRSAAGAVTATGVTASSLNGAVVTSIRLRNVSDATARLFVTGSAVDGVSARTARLAEPKGVLLQPGDVVDLPVTWTPKACPATLSARGPLLRTQVITPTSDRTVLAAFDSSFDRAWLAALAEACGP